jgi:hypothetical protein
LTAYAALELPNFDIFSAGPSGTMAPKVIINIAYFNRRGVKLWMETGRFH